MFFTGDSIVRTHISAAPSSSSSSTPPPPFSSSSVLSANVDVPESTSTGSLESTATTVATTDLTAHPFSNLLIKAEAEKSSSCSSVVAGGGGGVDSSCKLFSTVTAVDWGGEMVLCGGGGGGGSDETLITDGVGSGFLAGTVVSLVCSPLGGTGGGFCLPVTAIVDVLTGGVGAPVPTNVCKTDAGTGVCCCAAGRWSVVVADDAGGAAAR